MRLIRCHVENFGKLSGFDYEFNDGLNVILEDNGWGKSTFMAFIKCMLYGFAGEEKRRSAGAERKKYMPWQGGAFGGKLCFEADGNVYEVIRKWGGKVSEDECRILDLSTNLETARFVAATSGNSESLGRQLFGIDEDSFERSAFIAQGDVPGGVTSDINAKINNLTDNTNDMGNFEIAMEIFKNKLNAMSESRATGELAGKKAEINKLKGDILMEDSLETGLKDLKGKLLDAKKEIERLSQDNDRLGKHLDEMTKWQDAQVLRERYKLYDKAMCEAKDNYEDAQRDARKAKEEDGVPVRMPGIMIIGIVLAILGLAAAVAGMVMHGDDKTFVIVGMVLAGTGVLLLIIGLGALAKAKEQSREAHEAYVAAEVRQDSCYEAYKEARKKLEDYTREYGTEFLNANDGMGFTDESGRSFNTGTEINDEIKRNNLEIERLRGFIASYAIQTDEKQEALDELRDKKARLIEAEGELTAGREKVRQLELARDMLSEAKDNMTARYIGPLTERFAHYYSSITGAAADNYTIDAKSNVTVEDKGFLRDTETLSTGLKDAVGFCLRMALVDAMYKDEKPPIIIDDAFSNMDEKNYKGAIRVLAQVSQKYQVIYYTCHNMV